MIILSVRNTRCRTDERRNTHAQRHLELTRAAVTRGLDSIRILKFFFFFFFSFFFRVCWIVTIDFRRFGVWRLLAQNECFSEGSRARRTYLNFFATASSLASPPARCLLSETGFGPARWFLRTVKWARLAYSDHVKSPEQGER